MQVRVIGPLLGAWGKEKYGLKPVKVDAMEHYVDLLKHLKEQVGGAVGGAVCMTCTTLSGWTLLSAQPALAGTDRSPLPNCVATGLFTGSYGYDLLLSSMLELCACTAMLMPARAAG
jgi:hypothetical protein